MCSRQAGRLPYDPKADPFEPRSKLIRKPLRSPRPLYRGKTSLQSACDLRAARPEDYRGCATRSDFWEAYAAAFPTRTHRSCGKVEGETNHVERWFGTLRARVSRLVRKAYSCSKNAENHLDAIHLFITTYNLVIQQKTTKR